ncbi:MAG: hypothetical protein M0R46_08150 [Candidatus Muirbacterium halophilum]|nr:hypothetical protein [Candidatus Muirbacterium halophilum]MCK9475874.1 hypothetical protein [Candidatus Muirbacterium halophilum]
MEKLKEKFLKIVKEKPLGIDISSIKLEDLKDEIKKNPDYKDKLLKFSEIFKQMEGHKQWISQFYVEKKDEIHFFKESIFYNELVQIQIFFEFINHLNVEENNCPNLYQIISIRNQLRLNKIRNSIAHFDWSIKGDKITFHDNNFEQSFNYIEVSEFSSMIGIIAIYLTF